MSLTSSLSPWPPRMAPTCPVCGESATARSHGRRTLLAGPGSGFDEDGEYHNHDPNWSMVDLTCPNGHTWKKSSRNSCPNHECDYGGETNYALYTQAEVTCRVCAESAVLRPSHRSDTVVGSRVVHQRGCRNCGRTTFRVDRWIEPDGSEG